MDNKRIDAIKNLCGDDEYLRIIDNIMSGRPLTDEEREYCFNHQLKINMAMGMDEVIVGLDPVEMKEPIYEILAPNECLIIEREGDVFLVAVNTGKSIEFRKIIVE